MEKDKLEQQLLTNNYQRWST